MLADVFLPLDCRYALAPRDSWAGSDCASSCCTLAFASSGEAVPVVNDIAIENGPELCLATLPGDEVCTVVWTWLNDPPVDINLPILVLGRATNSTVAIPMPVANTILNACSSAVRFTPSLWA